MTSRVSKALCGRQTPVAMLRSARASSQLQCRAMSSNVVPQVEPPVLRVAGEPETGEAFRVRRVYCVAKNYAAHTIEMGGDPKTDPPPVLGTFLFKINGLGISLLEILLVFIRSLWMTHFLHLRGLSSDKGREKRIFGQNQWIGHFAKFPTKSLVSVASLWEIPMVFDQGVLADSYYAFAASSRLVCRKW